MKIYDDPKIEQQITEAERLFNDNKERTLGVTLMQPFESMNSSARKLMFSLQATHRLNLTNPEVPLIGTGYENEFGKKSSSYLVSNDHWKVIGKISKYSHDPDLHYFLILINDNQELDILERVSYCHNTETYGFMYNNSKIDNLDIGSNILKDQIIRTSTAYDEFGNHMDGINLSCCYMALPKTTEDPVVISRSAADRLSAPMIRKVEIRINDNDIPLNLYGDRDVYRIFPDIGEEIKNGILCAIRRENKDESLFAQSIDRLSTILISDDSYKLTGKVLDINVYSNKQFTEVDDENELYNCYEGQLAGYINEDKSFCRCFVEFMQPYINNSNYKKSYNLSYMYDLCISKLSGVQYIKDKVFSNILVEIYIYTENTVHRGDKLSNRFGGKGVIAEVRADELMPRVDGVPVDLIWDQGTCFNRLNLGQLSETSLNNISKNILNFMDMNILHADECLEMLIQYLESISTEFADSVKDWLEGAETDDELMQILGSFITESDDGIFLSIKPMSECVGFDKIRKIHHDFPWIKPKPLETPMLGSNGQYRFVTSKKTSTVGSQYVYRLKQYAKEKHSATSLSSTNIRNENAKSKNSKMYLAVNSSTPIRNGEMEQMIYSHLGSDIAVLNLMLMSTSPKGRRSTEQLLFGDPYNIDVKLDEDAKSRSAEKVNCTLKTMGIRIKFVKKLKQKKNPFTKHVKYGSPFIRHVHESPFTKHVKAGSPFVHVDRKK